MNANWQQELLGIIQTPPPRGGEIDLALGFSLEAAALEDSSWGISRQELTAQHLAAGKKVFVSIRPLRRSKRPRAGFIKTGLSWRNFEFRMPNSEYNKAHQDALTRIFALSESLRSHTKGVVEQLWLNSFHSHIVYEALEAAQQAGVEFVGLGNLTKVNFIHNAKLELRLYEESDIKLQAALKNQAPNATLRTLGENAVVAIEAAEALIGENWEINIGSLEHKIPAGLERLINRVEPIRIPKAEYKDFTRLALGQLQQIAPVVSPDGSVEIEEIKPARLGVKVNYLAANSLHLEWAWYYPSSQNSYPLEINSKAKLEPERKPELEAEILAKAINIWPALAGVQTLYEDDTLEFTKVLKQLEQNPDFEVHYHGSRPQYRELTGAPQIKIEQFPAPKTDWFSLAFQITIEGKEIPFPKLFTALVQGRSKLLLPDGSYFNLNHAAFTRLKQLIKEGEALAEWDPKSQRVHKSQVKLMHAALEVADQAKIDRSYQRILEALEENQEVDPPKALNAELRDYQKAGLNFLAKLYDWRLGGVLADDMGLGKTVQCLALTTLKASEAKAKKPFLVLAPTSVVNVWVQEAKKFAPSLKVLKVSGTAKKRKQQLRAQMPGVDVVIASYAVLRLDAEEFMAEEFAGVIFDEAQFLKNHTTKVHQVAKELNSDFKLAITGTPLENSLLDVWALYSITVPGILGTAANFRTHFVHPIQAGEMAEERLSLLRRTISPFLLRRTKEQVAPDLPRKTEQVIEVELEPQHRALYDRVLQRERKKILGLVSADLNSSRFIMFRSLTLLRMLALDPGIVDLKQLEAEADLTYLQGSKLPLLVEKVKEIVEEGHRVLIFSQFTSYLGKVRKAFEAENIAYTYLDGATRARAEVVAEFKQGASAFLISLKAGGFGLTLTEADYVFMLDPWWNPAAENQAIDRAHRIGQDKPVMVYRLIAVDTVEEKVRKLQVKKQELFDSFTDSSQAFTNSLTLEEIKELFS